MTPFAMNLTFVKGGDNTHKSTDMMENLGDLTDAQKAQKQELEVQYEEEAKRIQQERIDNITNQYIDAPILKKMKMISKLLRE